MTSHERLWEPHTKDWTWLHPCEGGGFDLAAVEHIGHGDELRGERRLEVVATRS